MSMDLLFNYINQLFNHLTYSQNELREISFKFLYLYFYISEIFIFQRVRVKVNFEVCLAHIYARALYMSEV